MSLSTPQVAVLYAQALRLSVVSFTATVVMYAIPETTREHIAAHPAQYSTVLGRTSFAVSGAGFGGYRVSSGVEGHRNALRRALLGGINLIDTSTNYADGGSEELVGEVLRELGADGTLKRNNVVVVTKAGYMQGSNYELAKKREAGGNPFPDVVHYAEGLWHSISPEFLEDQITRSLERLGLETIDVLLLHNPEYYLRHAVEAGAEIEAAQQEYYRRIEGAFEHLEVEAEKGRIQWYGISSNTFPAPKTDPAFTSLERVIAIAEHIGPHNRFGVIQFPANIIEREFVVEKNQQSGLTLIELAHQKNLGVLINRPLNAITDEGLVRLADFPVSEIGIDDERVVQTIERLNELEETFNTETILSLPQDAEANAALREFVSVGYTLESKRDSFGTIEQYNDVLSRYFAPRLGYVAQYLREKGAEEHIEWYAEYIAQAQIAFRAIGDAYSRVAQQRSSAIKEQVGEALGEMPEGSLSSIAIRMLLGAPGVSSVLVGMRREEYVYDVQGALRNNPLGNTDTWRQLNLTGIVHAPSANG